MIDLLREIWKPVLKLDFTSYGILESLSEFGPLDIIKKGNWAKQYHIYSNFVTVHCTADIALS
jgi:hypothetical protein